MQTIKIPNIVKYIPQTDNNKLFYIKDGFVYTYEGDVKLFKETEMDENTRKLKDWNTQCFITSSTQFLNTFNAMGKLPTPVSEEAYMRVLLHELVKGEKRTFWEPHSRVMNKVLAPAGYKFKYTTYAKAQESIVKNISEGLPVICSIYIGDFLQGANGHIVLVVGVVLDANGKIYGLIVLDPYGNALKRYKDRNGDQIVYDGENLIKMVESPEHTTHAGIVTPL